MKTIRFLVPVLPSLLFPALLPAQRPLGDPFLVNLQTQGSQLNSHLAANAAGEFVVTWLSRRLGSREEAIYARRFGADGKPATGEILVTSFPDHLYSGLAMMADGSFVVVFPERAPGTSGAVRARWYAPDGALQDDVVLTREAVVDLSVTTRGDGGILLAWISGSPPFIRARAFGPDHAPLGPVVLVARLGDSPAVAVGPEGEFVVAFGGAILGDPANRDDDRSFVAIRRFAADGTPLERPLAASPITEITPFNIRVGKDGAGDFLVSWTGQFGLLGSGTFVRRYAADGTPLSRIIRLPMFATALAMGLRGNFVLAWTEYSVSKPAEIFARRFAADGSPLGPAVRVGGDAPGDQFLSAVAIGANGGFIVTWDSNERDPDRDFDVFARRFRRR